MQYNAMSITEAGQRPLFLAHIESIVDTQINSAMKLFYTSGPKWLRSI